ncbi:uracil-DNA glycosylase [Halobacteriaceae archaeon SHR40]|uniref:uracil-DNA glycosylase n=1 Tax=Halovenus amylolytica TaxID=2500550 RepID=UPI000FE367BA
MTEDAGADCWRTERVGVVGCERCPELVDSRSQIVNGVGPDDADLLFVGEAPGANEDEQGEPFVGRSGDVLDDGLRDVGLARQDVRITNCVRCRPPENRDPTSEELDSCGGYLDREIAAVDPAVIVTLGKVPGELVLDRSVAVTSEAGDIDEIEIDGQRWQVLVCVHPAATLYDPGQQTAFDEALQVAAEYAGESGQSTLGEF